MTTGGPIAESASRPSLTDSPWFWAYLFGAAALVALFIAGNKFGPRQAQIEREYQARTRAAQRLNGQEPSLPLSTPQNTLVTLQPLGYLLAAITIVGWLLYWRSRRTAAVAPLTSPLDSSSSAPANSSHVDSGQPQ